MAGNTYTINIERGTNDGTLKFSHGSVTVDTTCWWDPDNKIDSGTYTGYATWMANKPEADGQPCPWKGNAKHRPGIWFGNGVKSKNGTVTNNGIYIHKGTSAAWSQGCIVCAASEVLKIWNAVTPKDTANVTIVVTDKEPAGATPAYSSPTQGWGCVFNPFHSLSSGRWGLGSPPF